MRPTPDGDCAALGAEVIAKSECGDYGEDELKAWRFPDGAVVIERVGQDGSSRRWRVEATDTLRVTSEAWGNHRMRGVETVLTLVTLDGEEVGLSHFEFSGAWGGPTDDTVTEVARTIASAAGCTTLVVPMTFPEPSATESAKETVVATPAPVVVSPPPAVVAPRKPLVADVPGPGLLASLPCGDKGNEELRATKLPSGTVVIENTTSGERWEIAPGDVLRIIPYAVAGGPGGVWTCLERVRSKTEDRIAGFYCWDPDREGPDEVAVAAFVAKVAAAALCDVAHREMIWD
jgi:hypothetical protein